MAQIWKNSDVLWTPGHKICIICFPLGLSNYSENMHFILRLSPECLDGMSVSKSVSSFVCFCILWDMSLSAVLERKPRKWIQNPLLLFKVFFFFFPHLFIYLFIFPIMYVCTPGLILNELSQERKKCDPLDHWRCVCACDPGSGLLCLGERRLPCSGWHQSCTPCMGWGNKWPYQLCPLSASAEMLVLSIVPGKLSC